MKKIFALLFILISLMAASCTVEPEDIIPSLIDRLDYTIESNTNNEQSLLDKKLYTAAYFGNLESAKEAIESGANLDEMIGVNYKDSNPYVQASINNNKEIAQYIIESGANVDQIVNYEGTTLLMWEAWRSKLNECTFIIEHGANVNLVDDNGYTALEYAIDDELLGKSEKDILDIIELFLDNGSEIRPITLEAALTTKDTSRYQVLRVLSGELLANGYETGLSKPLEAAILGKTDELNKLIKNGDIIDEEIQRILFFTAAFGTSETMELLKNNGGDFKKLDSGRNSLLNTAVKYDNLDTVKYMVENDGNIERKNEDRDTPLIQSIKKGYYKITEYLLDSGCKINYCDIGSNYWWEDPYVVAAQYGDLEIMKLLLDYGYELNNYREEYAFFIACDYDCLRSVKYFIDRGISPNVQTISGGVMHICSDLEVIKFLVEHGGDINQDYVLKYPAQDGDYDIVKFLIEQGADVNIGIDNEYTTPICGAILTGQYDIVKLLIENGAEVNIVVLKSATQHLSTNVFLYILEHCDDINMQDEEGTTALMYGVFRNNVTHVKLLVENGADLYLTNDEGHTALDIAKENNRETLIEYLESVMD